MSWRRPRCPRARADLIAKWAEFKKQKGGLRHTDQFGDFDHLTSPVIEYLDHVVSALSMTVSDHLTSEEGWTLSKPEAMLRDTNVLLRRQGIEPSDEPELQKVMHDYLRAAFPGDFTTKLQVNGAIKDFKPDCGIMSVGADVEFKMVNTEEAAKVAFSGVVEDTAGYKGSKDWTKFFAVIYQGEAFISESEIQKDMQRIKAGTWKAFLANDRTSPRKPRKVKNAAKKAVRAKQK